MFSDTASVDMVIPFLFKWFGDVGNGNKPADTVN